MDAFVKTVVLENGFEAQLLCAILAEEKIEYYIKSYQDAAYDGLFQSSTGWGALYSAPESGDLIREMLAEIRLQAEAAPK